MISRLIVIFQIRDCKNVLVHVIEVEYRFQCEFTRSLSNVRRAKTIYRILYKYKVIRQSKL